MDTTHGNGVGQSSDDNAEIRPAADRRRSKRAPEQEVAHRYTDAEKMLALGEVALAGGNVSRATTVLKKRGNVIPRRTIQDWKEKEPELYGEVTREVLPRINAEIAGELTNGIRLELEAHRKGAERLGKEIDDPEKIAPRDLSKAVRDAAVSGAVLIDKRQLVTNQPTEIKQRQSVSETLRSLKALGVVIEGTAEDVTDAEVVPPDPEANS